MKHLIISIFTLSLLVSCVEVKFEEPQPHGIKALKIIPENIQGTYLIGTNDTMQILSDGFVLLNDSSKKDDIHRLSDIFIIKKWRIKPVCYKTQQKRT